jgi:hypothetical protein
MAVVGVSDGWTEYSGFFLYGCIAATPWVLSGVLWPCINWFMRRASPPVLGLSTE